MKHDVFISFRGTDVRHGILSHLRKALCRRQIDAYVDDRLDRGDEISAALVRAIEGSQILLVIFSEDYASSKWCLDELAKIIECMERKKRIVIPVFYNIDPSVVRLQKGCYRDALAKHEENFKDSKIKLQSWKYALENAAKLSGFHYSSNFEDESDLVDEIVEDVLEKLSKFCPSVSNGLVGIDQNIAQVESLLVMESKELRIIGIWGMGGIGKTTLARAVFNRVSLQYEGHCFLENVREELEKFQLSYLREKLHSELLEEENLHRRGTSKSSFVKIRLSRKKVIIVLDDVNNPEQVRYLVGKPICFGPGSRVIVTSRDKHVLTGGGVHGIHEVLELNYQDSLKLFCLYAFNESQTKMEYKELSRKAIVNAIGNPLALKVLGSYFHSKSKDTWECALRKLKKYPNEEIQSVLRFSYDGLHEVEKSIFLDIAFFLKDEDKDYVIRQLDACGFYGASGIQCLLDKALITISNENRIQMHDLVQEMGWEIVCQESVKDPGRRSRLRDKDEVCDVLKNNRGTDVVEGMLLDMSLFGSVPLSVDTFQKMSNLRFLKLYSPTHIVRPMLLRNFKEILEGVQDFVNAKPADTSSRSIQLLELPQLSKISNPEYDNLSGVAYPIDLMKLPDLSGEFNQQVYLLESVRENDVEPSVTSLQIQLICLILSGWKELLNLACEIHIKSLDYLLINECTDSKEFSLSTKEIRQLKLTDTVMEILNSSFGLLSNLDCSDHEGAGLENLSSDYICLRSTYYHKVSNYARQHTGKQKLHILFDGLQYYRRFPVPFKLTWLTALKNINVSHCKLVFETSMLHGLFHDLRSLRTLSLTHCSSLSELPDNINVLSQLCELRLDGSSVESLPASIKDLSELEILSLSGCERLRSLPELPLSIQYLCADDCVSLQTVVGFAVCTDLSQQPHHTNLSFKNCVNLDVEKLTDLLHKHVRWLAHGFESRRGRVEWNSRNTNRFSIWYPECRIPEWFTCQTSGASITLELPLHSNDIFGCLVGIVLSSLSFSSLTFQVKCQSYLEDGKMSEHVSEKHRLYGLESGHVYITYSDSCGHLLTEIKDKINYQCASYNYNPKVTLEFSFVVNAIKAFRREMAKPKLDSLIKGCGICLLI